MLLNRFFNRNDLIRKIRNLPKLLPNGSEVMSTIFRFEHDEYLDNISRLLEGVGGKIMNSHFGTQKYSHLSSLYQKDRTQTTFSSATEPF